MSHTGIYFGNRAKRISSSSRLLHRLGGDGNRTELVTRLVAVRLFPGRNSRSRGSIYFTGWLLFYSRLLVSSKGRLNGPISVTVPKPVLRSLYEASYAVLTGPAVASRKKTNGYELVHVCRRRREFHGKEVERSERKTRGSSKF